MRYLGKHLLISDKFSRVAKEPGHRAQVTRWYRVVMDGQAVTFSWS